MYRDRLERYLAEIKLLIGDIDNTEICIKCFLEDRQFENEDAIYYLIDFSEIYRILHPEFDRLVLKRRGQRYVGRFAIEQLALRYLLSQDAQVKIVLVEPYLSEFYKHFDKIKDKLERLFQLVTEDEVLREEYFNRLRKDAYLDQLLTVSKMIETQKRGGLAQVDDVYILTQRSFMNLLWESERKRHVEQGIGKFKALIGGSMLLPKQLAFLGPAERAIPESEVEKDEVFIKLRKILDDSREYRGSTVNNRFDALAFTYIFHWTKQYGNDHKRFYLLSSSRKLQLCLKTLRTDEPSSEILTYLPETRDLYYFILRLYATLVDVAKVETQLGDLLANIKVYREQLHRLEEEGRNEYAQSDHLTNSRRKLIELRRTRRQLQPFRDIFFFRTAVDGTSPLLSLRELLQKLLPNPESVEAVLEALDAHSVPKMLELLESLSRVVADRKQFRSSIQETLAAVGISLSALQEHIKNIPEAPLQSPPGSS
jgi:hypothetical protein